MISLNQLAIAAKSFAVLVAFACLSSLLLAHRRFCLPSSPIKPQRHFGSLPHQRFSFLSSIQLPWPFDFHPHRLFAASNPSDPLASTSTGDPSPTLQTFFFFLTTSSMRLLKLYLFIAFLFWFMS